LSKTKQQAYYDKLAQIGCILCLHKGIEDTPAQMHHIIRNGIPRDKSPVIPLCYEHHQGKTGVHGLRSRGFTKLHGVSEETLLSFLILVMGGKHDNEI
jgi:hypothetical protein